MKVYVLTTHVVNDYEDYGINVRAFSTKTKARKALSEWKKSEMPYIKRDELTYSSYKDGFEAYEEGDYTRNRSIANIKESEVE